MDPALFILPESTGIVLESVIDYDDIVNVSTAPMVEFSGGSNLEFSMRHYQGYRLEIRTSITLVKVDRLSTSQGSVKNF